MASRWRQREARRPSSWRQSLLFNSLLLLLPIMAAEIIGNAYTSDIATNPMSLEARTETRQEIEETFRNIGAEDGQDRNRWANRIELTLQERDFSAARGYLLAAPLMMNRQDSQAVLAAAEAEAVGTEDQRLARAALLFLPDTIRASYQRAIAPPQIEPGSDAPFEPEPEVEPTTEADADTDTDETVTTEAVAPSTPEPFSSQRAFFLLCDAADLSRRSQRWVLGEQVDSMQLRLRALGLIKQRDAAEDSQDFVDAASVLIAAQRSDRLNARFERYITSRVDDALPDTTLRESLAETFEPVMTTQQRAEQVMQTYATATDPEGLARLSRDMEIIARLAELTSSSGALTLVEQASSPEDMRRALLVTEAGGERSVALARELGPKVLELAQIGVKWTPVLALQAMALMALGMALLWTTLSAFTQAETIRPSRR